MPKKAKKSIARKYKGSSRRETEVPPQSQNDLSELVNDPNPSREQGLDTGCDPSREQGLDTGCEMDWSLTLTTSEAQIDMQINRSERSEVTNVRVYDNGLLVLNELNTPAANPQPGPSGLQFNEMHYPTANVVTVEEPEDSSNIIFEKKLLALLKRSERRQKHSSNWESKMNMI